MHFRFLPNYLTSPYLCLRIFYKMPILLLLGNEGSYCLIKYNTILLELRSKNLRRFIIFRAVNYDDFMTTKCDDFMTMQNIENL